MTKELLAKANILNNKLMYLDSLIEDVEQNNSPITIQTGMVHNLQIDNPNHNDRLDPLEERTFDLILEVVKNYRKELQNQFDLLTEED